MLRILRLISTIQAISKTFTSEDLRLDWDLEDTLKTIFLDMKTCDWGHRVLVNISEEDIVAFFNKVSKSLVSYRV